MATRDVRAVMGEVQGNILDAYRHGAVRQLVVEVVSAAKARAALRSMLGPSGTGITITSGAPTPTPATCVNVGMTFEGLRALGLPEASLASFPPEFREGMVARAARLGDIGTSSPASWSNCLGDPSRAHLVFSVYGTKESSAEAAAGVLATGRNGFTWVGHFDGEVLLRPVTAMNDKGQLVERQAHIEHFGFRDGLSQPYFEGISKIRGKGEPAEPLGVVLLGHPTTSPVEIPIPEPWELGFQGTFAAFRVLSQDVAGFRRYVKSAVDGQREPAVKLSKELVMAHMCGRWPNGVPLSLAPTKDEADAFLLTKAAHHGLNDFDFSDDAAGTDCPVGSHIRRSNPRNAQIVQRPTNRARRLVRRGMPFGPPLGDDEDQGDTRERGLLGSFLCASLSSQFEAMQSDWINLGLQDPSITSTNDPLVGANEAASASFAMTTGNTSLTLRDLPRFVETLGGAYLFLPSMEALDWIGGARWIRRNP